MLFNSIEFAFFLPLVFILYWFVFNKKLRTQNFLILVVSYFFYGWWDWRFLSLILFSSMLDFLIGVELAKSENEKKRKALLITSLVVNLGFLGFFKYYNFFTQSFVDAFTFFGYQIEASRLNIILPVGISFYTFQTLSYSIDVYKRKLVPTSDWVSFSAFVSFFPQLVAGPIERATNLLPQFHKKRIFSYSKAADGMRQILWGLFKKIVIADNCAVFVNEIFDNIELYNGSELFIGGVFFAFQIYCDFSGYSDIAIGTARLFGFDLMKNFAFPYFSRDFGEFWRRWHISLSTWFKDYLYIPLGGSRNGLLMSIRNTFIIFLVSGFWHGANWTFIVWGGLNALYFMPLLLLNKNKKSQGIVSPNSFLPSLKDTFQILTTFIFTVIAWIFFRAESLSQAMLYLKKMFSKTLVSLPEKTPLLTLSFLVFFVVCEWVQRNREHALQIEDYQFNKPLRWLIYFSLLFLIVSFGGFQQKFIYFNF